MECSALGNIRRIGGQCYCHVYGRLITKTERKSSVRIMISVVRLLLLSDLRGVAERTKQSLAWQYMQRMLASWRGEHFWIKLEPFVSAHTRPSTVSVLLAAVRESLPFLFRVQRLTALQVRFVWSNSPCHYNRSSLWELWVAVSLTVCKNANFISVYIMAILSLFA